MLLIVPTDAPFVLDPVDDVEVLAYDPNDDLTDVHLAADAAVVWGFASPIIAHAPAADAAQVEAAAGSLAPVRDPAAYLSGAEQRAVDRASIVAGAVVGAGATAAFGAVAGTWRRLRRRQ